MTIYALLNSCAGHWPYDVFTGKYNKPKDYRKIERANIRSSLDVLRQCRDNSGWVKSGRGGWSIHYKHGAYMQGYHWLKTGDKIQDTPMLKACLLLGIPIIDTNTIPDDKIHLTVNLPMIGFRCDFPPYGAMSYAPLGIVAKLYADLGATLYNVEE